MKTFKAKVKAKGPFGEGIYTEIRIQAANFVAAKALIEAQYGKGSIVFGPVETH